MALQAVFDNILETVSVDSNNQEIQDIVSAVEELVHRYARRIKEHKPDLKISRILPCGSMKDRSSLWKTYVNNPNRHFMFDGIGEVPYIEFDFLAILEKPSEFVYVATACRGCKQIQSSRCSDDLEACRKPETDIVPKTAGIIRTYISATQVTRSCSRCETAFHGCKPWWPFVSWKTWKKTDSVDYLCTDMVDALFHNELVSVMCSSCSCFSMTVQEAECSGMECSNRRRCKIVPNAMDRNVNCDTCTVHKDTGFLQIAASSEADMMSRKRNKCSFILRWTSIALKLSASNLKNLGNKHISSVHIFVDFLPAFELAGEDLHVEHDNNDALLVAKKCSSCKDCCKWRISHTVQEMNALSSISEKHKMCYKMIKYIVQLFHYFDININSYHAKTVCLKHFIDCTNNDNNYSICVREILLNLSHAYKTGHLEEFVSKFNLFQREASGLARELELVEQMFKEFETEFGIDGIGPGLLKGTLIGRLQQMLLYFTRERSKAYEEGPYHFHPDSRLPFEWLYRREQLLGIHSR